MTTVYGHRGGFQERPRIISPDIAGPPDYWPEPLPLRLLLPLPDEPSPVPLPQMYLTVGGERFGSSLLTVPVLLMLLLLLSLLPLS